MRHLRVRKAQRSYDCDRQIGSTLWKNLPSNAATSKRLFLDLIAGRQKRFVLPPQRAASFCRRGRRIGELIRRRDWTFVEER